MSTPGHRGKTAPRPATIATMMAVQQRGSTTAAGLAEHMAENLATIRQRLRNLVQCGHLNSWMHEVNHTYAYALTPTGAAIVATHQAIHSTDAAAPAPTGQRALPRQPVDMRATTYDSAELHPYTGRPGAMHAYALPSRVGDRLEFPRGATK